MSGSHNPRGNWGSQLGFIVAASGSAIGLGNIWRFPYQTGENGGAVFVLIYIICVVMIGLPVMLAEVSIGRSAEKNPVGCFKKLSPGTRWKYLGLLGVITGLCILSFYSVVAGWTIGYVIKTLSGSFAQAISVEETGTIFQGFAADPGLNIILTFSFLFLTALVVAGGVEKGIERYAKILMPILFFLLLLLVIRSVTLPSASFGLSFYLKPDFSKLSSSTVISALGQAFFSLSLGMGTMITYGSYLSKRDNLVTSVGYVCFFDTVIALLAGLAIFPALFSLGGSPDQGPGLVFVVFPSIFAKIPGGNFFGTGFFILLVIAALTSTISLLEVVVAYFIEEFHWKRKTAAFTMTAAAFLLAIPSLLSSGAVSFLGSLPVIGISFLSLMDTLFGNYCLTLGSLLIALFVGWYWGVHRA